MPVPTPPFLPPGIPPMPRPSMRPPFPQQQQQQDNKQQQQSAVNNVPPFGPATSTRGPSRPNVADHNPSIGNSAVHEKVGQHSNNFPPTYGHLPKNISGGAEGSGEGAWPPNHSFTEPPPNINSTRPSFAPPNNGGVHHGPPAFQRNINNNNDNKNGPNTRPYTQNSRPPFVSKSVNQNNGPSKSLHTDSNTPPFAPQQSRPRPYGSNKDNANPSGPSNNNNSNNTNNVNNTNNANNAPFDRRHSGNHFAPNSFNNNAQHARSNNNNNDQSGDRPPQFAPKHEPPFASS
eukprot:Awhi_evm1s5855